MCSRSFPSGAITAGDQPLARVIGVNELKEIALIEQAQLQRFGFHQRADLAALERGDPGHALQLAQLPDRLV